jgi:hypothetical protein
MVHDNDLAAVRIWKEKTGKSLEEKNEKKKSSLFLDLHC